MKDNAFVLTSCDWVDAASSSKIKVLDFPKARKRRIKSLGEGSVVLVACREGGETVIKGEALVREARKIYSRVYRKLARAGQIFSPQELKPGEYVWALLLDYFIKYPRGVKQSELRDIRTSTSRKPISEWPIIGLTYIKEADSWVIDAVRLRGGILTYVLKALNEIKSQK